MQRLIAALAALGLGLHGAATAAEKTYDLVVYGGTSAAVTAAVQAKRMGRSVIVVSPDKHLGGLSSGRLGFTDTERKEVIGGLAREFYHRVWRHYQTDDAWRWQRREEYGNRGQGTAAIDGAKRTMWIFEPHVAEAVFDDLVTEHDCLVRKETPEPVGIGSYTMDSHNVERYVTPEGHVQNEGDVGVRAPRPYRISYGSLVPKRAECTNLLVPVCVSSSHIAFGSIRMEPIFMILGQSSATAAVMALDEDAAVQDLDYAKLRKRLLAHGQVVEWE